MTNPLAFIKKQHIKKFKERNSIKLKNSNKQFNEKMDLELKSSIDKDIKRTYCEVDIFHLEEVRSDLVEILYVWAKENPEYGYQQGMNEILGVVYSLLVLDYFNVNEYYRTKSA